MPAEFYRSLNRFAEESSSSSEGVLGQVRKQLESAYHVKVGEPNLIYESPQPLIPVWFKLSQEFWTRLDRLFEKTGTKKKLVTEGLYI